METLEIRTVMLRDSENGTPYRAEVDHQGNPALLHVATLIERWGHYVARTDADGNRRTNDQINAGRSLLRRLHKLRESDHEYISLQAWDHAARGARLERFYDTSFDAPCKADLVDAQGRPRNKWLPGEWHDVTYPTVESLTGDTP